ncbi:MAG: glucuronate isomerase, partial [Chloroflexota bacterium]|nr:glucuronate isomerase [Chloroflexota bacterium]
MYAAVANLPIVSPHGHVPPALLADPAASFGSPADLFIIPDHYVTRMLYSQGLPLEALGVPTRDGTPVETDHRAIWQHFADHFQLFRGTPTGLWLADELINVFGVTEKLTSASAQRIYDHLAERLAQPAYTPRALFERFNITVLCTTDAATDPLPHHQALRNPDVWKGEQGWSNRIRPTFRPDAVVNLQAVGWREQITRLSEVSGLEISDFASYIRALEDRRAFFKRMGATATDHAALTPYTTQLEAHECETIFLRALHGQATNDDAARFMGHMLLEMARMSAEDGLVMQLHVGSLRNHHDALFERFGPDIGADIPI